MRVEWVSDPFTDERSDGWLLGHTMPYQSWMKCKKSCHATHGWLGFARWRRHNPRLNNPSRKAKVALQTFIAWFPAACRFVIQLRKDNVQLVIEQPTGLFRPFCADVMFAKAVPLRPTAGSEEYLLRSYGKRTNTQMEIYVVLLGLPPEVKCKRISDKPQVGELWSLSYFNRFHSCLWFLFSYGPTPDAHLTVLIWYGPKVFNRGHNYQGPHMSLLRAFNITVQRFQQTMHIIYIYIIIYIYYICVYAGGHKHHAQP